jgi:hypothetical protein
MGDGMTDVPSDVKARQETSPAILLLWKRSTDA